MQKWKNVVYFHESEVTRELTQLAVASVAYHVHNALYHSKLAHNSPKSQLITWMTTFHLLQNPSICFGGGLVFVVFLRNVTLNYALLTDISVS